METKELQEVLRAFRHGRKRPKRRRCIHSRSLRRTLSLTPLLRATLSAPIKKSIVARAHRKKRCLNDTVSDDVWSSCSLLPQKTILHDYPARLKSASRRRCAFIPANLNRSNLQNRSQARVHIASVSAIIA